MTDSQALKMDIDIHLYESFPFIRIFLAAGGDLQTKHCQVLSSLLKEGDKETVSYVMNTTDDYTVLSQAARLGCVDVVRFIIGRIDKESLNKQNRFGWTPLMEAVAYAHLEVVKILIKAGADTSIKNFNGVDARTIATWVDNKKIADLL